MSSFTAIERIVWLHQQAARGRFPNTAGLAERFEVDPRTAKRTVAFLRDRLGAPLEYVAARRGYAYTDPNFSLPFLEVSQEEMLAILLARNLLTPSAGGAISRAIQGFSRRLFAVTAGLGLSADRMESSFSASWPGFSPARAETFQAVLQSLLGNRVLSFDYHSPLDGPTRARLIEPHHLTHYLGSWVLLGWCRHNSGWRRFFLSRMNAPVVREEDFIPRDKSEWQPFLDLSFGLFQGPDRTEVALRFNAFRAPWIREQVWHPEQRVTELPDGGLELRLPVADLREIKLKVMQFGADVEVLEPEALRREVVAEVRRMGEMYARGASQRTGGPNS